jgi:uroporphyrinogen decarboxylase
MMLEMKPRERFLATLKRRQPDRVPCYDFLFSFELFEHVLGKLSDDYVYNSEDALKCANLLGFDGLWIPFGGLVGDYSKKISPDKYVDEWGTTFKKDKASWPIDGPVDYPIKTRNDLANYIPPSPESRSRMLETKKALKINNGEIAILGGLNGPLTTATFLMGLEDICINLYEDPELLESIFALSNRFWIEAGKKLVNEGVDAIIFGEDLGYDKNLFASPQLLRKHLFPYIKELVTTFTSKGIPVIMHCDGRIHDVFEDMVNFGIYGYHPSERKSGMSLKWAKENFGDKICLFGNVDSSKTLPYGTPEEVEQEALQCLKDAAKGGGYIFGSDHSLHDGIPMDNIFKMFETAKRYGKYPLNFDNL